VRAIVDRGRSVRQLHAIRPGGVPK
jgi:hypothetical protein